MRFRPPTFVAVSLVAALLGGGAYAAASSIDTQPAPKMVVPSSPSPRQATPAASASPDDKGGLRSPGVSDDTATPAASATASASPDDKGGLRSPGVSDDRATPAASATASASPDDKGGLRSRGGSGGSHHGPGHG
jgi:hypothetical protein